MRRTTTTIASMLGLTQRQIALLLRVPRAQWSMYELGRRNLPLKTKQLLAEMLAFLRIEEKSSDVQKHVIAYEESRKTCLENALEEIEYKLRKIAKKIKPLEKVYQTNLVAIGFVEYVNTRSHIREALDGELLRIIGTKAKKVIQTSVLNKLTLLKMKEESLQMEKLVIGSQLNVIGRKLEELRNQQLSYN